MYRRDLILAIIHASYISDPQLFVSREAYQVEVNHTDAQVNMDLVVLNFKKFVFYLNS